MPSSVVANMIYNPDTSVLRVIFVSGSIYDYLDVPPEVYEAMRTSGSKGIYLNRQIKKNYKYKKIQ
jgi:hypothetical protein